MYFKMLLLCFFYTTTTFSQSNNLSIYLDCNEWICDKPYIKQELENVSFVRDQSDADVHIFFITQNTANKGRSFEIEFIGQKEYKKLHDVLKFDTNGDMTELQSSNMILKYLRFGLMRFWLEKGMGDQLSVEIKENDTDEKDSEIDPWKKWSFNIGAYGWFYGQESQSSTNLNGNITAEQVTDKNKFRIKAGLSINSSIFTYNGEKIISDKRRKYLSIKDVISINDNWSVGIFSNLGSSVFGNYDFYASLEPGIEYNFFPYNESSKKQLVLFYKFGSRYNKYIETTSFNKEKELLWQQSLGLGGIVKQKWGNVSGSVIYENFMHNFSLNMFDFYLSTRIRLFKGLSLNFNGGYSIIHNQINIAASGTTKEELLLQQKQLISGFDYWFNTGFNYRFGSIYNTIVNARFDY